MGGVIDPWLVAGSSLYWAAVIFSFAFDGVSSARQPNLSLPSLLMSPAARTAPTMPVQPVAPAVPPIRPSLRWTP